LVTHSSVHWTPEDMFLTFADKSQTGGWQTQLFYNRSVLLLWSSVECKSMSQEATAALAPRS
jgi:hypothetical protein